MANAPLAPPHLFSPYQLGPFHLNHRIVLAPLTRCRSYDGVPQPHAIKYYADRTTPGGLLISEGTVISPTGQGYPHTPSIYKEEHIDAWKPITEAVRARGGVFVCQLWHCGRASHPSYQPNNALPIAPSPLPITDGNKVFSLKSMNFEEYPTPRALETSEIPALAAEYAQAATNAIAAGFDACEIHGANGYLVDEFLKEEANQREDKYGGSIENRCRFALEVVDAVAAAVGEERVGLRLSPFGGFLNGTDPHPYALVSYLLEELNKRHPNLLYIHVVESRAGGNNDLPYDSNKTLDPWRKIWKGPLMAAGGYSVDNGDEAVATNHCDLVAYGRWFLANSDFVKRAAVGATLNHYNRDTFYTQDPVVGYNDYPLVEETAWGESHAAQLASFKYPWAKKN